MQTLLQSIDPVLAFAGIGLFLFAMLQLEQALEGLLGSSFRRLLRNYTRHPASALGVGIISTAVLQSSSLIGVMSLALVGAGVVSLSSGIGIILGANLGTTVTGWLVSMLGFKLDLSATALPIVALGSLGSVLLRAWPHLAQAMRLLLAVGLLLWALGMMKAAVQPTPEALGQIVTQAGAWWQFFAAGLVAALVIQSSSAVMMITLSVLATGLIEITSAAALVVGADLGTTGTVLLGAIGGSAPRRRVAYAHLWFNLVNAVLALALIPLLPPILQWSGLGDPLIALVAFHSGFNLLGLALFYPFLGRFAYFLERRVGDTRTYRLRYLSQEVTVVAETGSEALHKETGRVIVQGLARYQRVFRSEPAEIQKSYLVFGLETVAPRYGDLKTQEQEIIHYATKLQQCALSAAQALRLHADLGAVRNTVHAAKCLKDIQHNLVALNQSSEPTLHALWQTLQKNAQALVEPLLSDYLGDIQAVAISQDMARLDPLEAEKTALSYDALQARCEQTHDETHRLIFGLTVHSVDSELQISSLLNMNRELFAAQCNLLGAVKAWCKSSKQD